MAFTFFFRDEHLLNLIAKLVLPELTGFSRIKFWDAGCAMGPEPYSLAIVCAENMGKFAFRNICITATDIDESGEFGTVIREGRYRDEEVKRMPNEILGRYFTVDPTSGTFVIDQGIRDSVRYYQHDLLGLRPIGIGFHLILCKNVLLHFTPEERVEVIRMFHGALADGGYFCTEQTQKLPDELSHLFERVSEDGQLFRKKTP
ncbi:MAG: chemotaxis protein CheR [Bacteroidetes bacterium]|nr:chemotaxis protein CheR [Bacteroidota bacterium]